MGGCQPLAGASFHFSDIVNKNDKLSTGDGDGLNWDNGWLEHHQALVWVGRPTVWSHMRSLSTSSKVGRLCKWCSCDKWIWIGNVLIDSTTFQNMLIRIKQYHNTRQHMVDRMWWLDDYLDNAVPANQKSFVLPDNVHIYMYVGMSFLCNILIQDSGCGENNPNI